MGPTIIPSGPLLLLLYAYTLQVRAHVEQQIGLIADGKAQKEAVVAHTLEQFRAKFMFFVGHITRMDALFEASFSPLSSSGEQALDAALCNWRCPYGLWMACCASVAVIIACCSTSCTSLCLQVAECMWGLCAACTARIWLCNLWTATEHPPPAHGRAV
jgi:hypothetical protein